MVEVKDWARPESFSLTDENEPRPAVSGDEARCESSGACMIFGEVGPL